MSKGLGVDTGETSDGGSVRAQIGDLRAALGLVDVGLASDRERIGLMTELTELVAAVAAAQTRLTAAYADSQRALGATVRGISAEVGLARRVGLSRASELVARSRVLVEDLPCTLAQMASGALSEERAHMVADRVSGLDPVVRVLVDEAVTEALPTLSDREVRDCVDRAVQGVDPEEAARRGARAHDRRRVSVRPLGDGMANLVVRCPLVDAATAFATLGRHADAMVALRRRDEERDTPDAPTRDQVMTDTAIAWLSGRERYEGPPVEVQLVMPVTGMFPDPGTGRLDDAPAELVGIGPLPAAVARQLLGRDARTRHDPALGANPRAMSRVVDREASRVTVRRVWSTADGRDLVGIESGRWVLPDAVRQALRNESAPSDGPASGVEPRSWTTNWLGPLARPPGPGELADLESGERCYRGLLRRFVVLRDQRCRAPWCGAPIRHIDHARPYRDEPRTTTSGGIGACVGHNLAKESPGHRVEVDPAAGRHTVTWQTPTGLRLRSIAPPLLGWGTQPPSEDVDHDDSPLERALEVLLSAA